MSDRITLPIRPSSDCPSRMPSNYTLTKRMAENIAGTLRNNFGTALDIANIRERCDDPEFALSDEQIECVKTVAKLAIASCVAQFQHLNFTHLTQRRSHEQRKREQAERDARKEAQRKEQEEESVEHVIDSIMKGGDDKLAELTERLLTARDAEHGTTHTAGEKEG